MVTGYQISRGHNKFLARCRTAENEPSPRIRGGAKLVLRCACFKVRSMFRDGTKTVACVSQVCDHGHNDGVRAFFLPIPVLLMRWHLRLLAPLIVLASVLGGRLVADDRPDVPLPETFFPALNQILANSAQRSPRMIQRAAEHIIAEGNWIQARAPELPFVGAGLTYYPLDHQIRGGANAPKPQNVQQLNYNLALTQPIYHWGALRDAARVGALGEKIAHGQTAEVYRALIVEIRGQYLQLIIKKRALLRMRYAQQLAERGLELAKLKLKQNSIAQSDMFGPTVAVEQAALATDRAVEDFENARTLFAKTCGGPAPTEAQLPDSIPAITQPTAALDQIYASFTGQTEPNNFNLQILRDQIAAEKLNYAAVSKRLRPNLNGVAGVSKAQNSYSKDPGARYDVQDLFIGLQLNWSIFDGFATRALKTNSLARRRELEQSYHDQKADLLEAVRGQKRQLDFAARSLAIGEKLYAGSANAIAYQKDQLARGLGSQSDIDNARLGVYDAEIGIYSARADYLMKLCDFLSTTLADPALSNLPPDLR